jgi:hypothetical protein
VFLVRADDHEQETRRWLQEVKDELSTQQGENEKLRVANVCDPLCNMSLTSPQHKLEEGLDKALRKVAHHQGIEAYGTVSLSLSLSQLRCGRERAMNVEFKAEKTKWEQHKGELQRQILALKHKDSSYLVLTTLFGVSYITDTAAARDKKKGRRIHPPQRTAAGTHKHKETRTSLLSLFLFAFCWPTLTETAFSLPTTWSRSAKRCRNSKCPPDLSYFT